MNGYFINSSIIQLDRKGITLADIKHIINQRTQRAVYTMGTQSAVGAFMSQNDTGSVLVLADGTGNQPGDVCTIISRTPDVAPERWSQHQYEAVVTAPEQLVSNGTLIDREAVYEQLRQTVELRAPEFEQSPILTTVPVTPSTTVLLPNDGQFSSIVIHDATTEQVLLGIANDGAGWYITNFVPNNWFASISGDIFNLGTLALSPQKWGYTHQVPLNYFYPVFISTVIATPVVAPVGVTAVWSETPMPNRQLGIHLDHEYAELTGADWDLQIDIGNYRYRMEKVGGLGNNFVTYSSFTKVGTPDGGTDWIADTPAKHEVTVTPDNIVRILAVTGPDGSFGVTQNRLFQYMTTLNGDSDLTLSVPVHIASYGVESQIQAAWVDYHTLVPEAIGFQEVPTWNLPFVDGVPQFDRSGGEFYAEFNDISETSAQATGLGQKCVLWTPPAQQLVMEHCRDLLIEVKNELQTTRLNQLSTIASLLTDILAKP